MLGLCRVYGQGIIRVYLLIFLVVTLQTVKRTFFLRKDRLKNSRGENHLLTTVHPISITVIVVKELLVVEVR